jgi:hypothetical protein
MIRSFHQENGNVKSRSNSVAVMLAGCGFETRLSERNGLNSKGGSDVESRRNSVAVNHCLTMPYCDPKTFRNPFGDHHADRNRNPRNPRQSDDRLVLTTSFRRAYSFGDSLMQNEIEILETRDNPMIVWY